MQMVVQGDAILYQDSYIFLINAHDGIAFILKNLEWMSRYCTVPPVFELFTILHLKTFKGRQRHYNFIQRKANGTTEGEGKNGLRSRKQPKPNNCNSDLQCSLLWQLQRTAEDIRPCLCFILLKSGCGTSHTPIKLSLNGRWQHPSTHIHTYQKNKNHWPLIYVVNIFPWLLSKPAPVRKQTNMKTIYKRECTSFIF